MFLASNMAHTSNSLLSSGWILFPSQDPRPASTVRTGLAGRIHSRALLLQTGLLLSDAQEKPCGSSFLLSFLSFLYLKSTIGFVYCYVLAFTICAKSVLSCICKLDM
jgi:hypothetical protein